MYLIFNYKRKRSWEMKDLLNFKRHLVVTGVQVSHVVTQELPESYILDRRKRVPYVVCFNDFHFKRFVSFDF